MACMPSRLTGRMTREDFGPQDGDSGNGKSRADRCSGDIENGRGHQRIFTRLRWKTRDFGVLFPGCNIVLFLTNNME